jgi:hypothetical protein
VDDDLEKLANVGHAVWEALMAQRGYRVTVRRKSK